jgi:hypothetical protein
MGALACDRCCGTDHIWCLGLRAAEAFLWRLAEIVHLILDLVALTLVGSKLLLVDRNHTLLLPSLVPHLVQLWSQLSNVGVDLTNTLLEVAVLALISLKRTTNLAVLVLEILNSAFDHGEVLLQLSSLVARPCKTVLQLFDGLDLLLVLILELCQTDFQIALLGVDAIEIAGSCDLLVLHFLHLIAKCGHLV